MGDSLKAAHSVSLKVLRYVWLGQRQLYDVGAHGRACRNSPPYGARSMNDVVDTHLRQLFIKGTAH